MHLKLITPVVVIVVLGAAGCGSNTKGAGRPGDNRSAPSLAFHLALRGAAEAPPGAPKGSGRAVIALHGSTQQLCWRFVHLKGFTGPTYAHIHRGRKGTAGGVVVPLGISFHHQGCVSVNAAVIRGITRDPPGYYVNIHSSKYPGGAIRSQL